MKNIKLISVIFALAQIGCKPSSTKNELPASSKSSIDTDFAPMNEPKPGKTADIDTSQLNCYISLTSRIYKIKLINVFDTASETTLSEYISVHKYALSKQKIYLITSNDVKSS